MSPNPRNRRGTRRAKWYLLAAVMGMLVLAGIGVYILSHDNQPRTETEPVILYVNQGNGAVNDSNFGRMLSFAAAHGFNTVFFQVYRQGILLFGPGQLSVFVNESHGVGLRIFLALYITNSSQALPVSIYGLGEDGINLDMSTLNLTSQQALLVSLQTSYHGQTAITTTDMASALRPDLLVLETYGTGLQQYVRHGAIASVGVFATSNEQDYKSQFLYALQNSDGVMVFDYAGLVKRGY
ncbi:MAG: hypothetical protein LYZ66_06730 [Nitrososphaerales archaeon]|nr:hypothetical protein [Nitrososphaerales archaeon]